jgi:hypothetical protein
MRGTLFVQKSFGSRPKLQQRDRKTIGRQSDNQGFLYFLPLHRIGEPHGLFPMGKAIVSVNYHERGRPMENISSP